ncbi:aldo/keto reductase [Floricoccus penangensis]|uniref:aldo/keto reductase n=1 Tax=Floricoccus penangensis TaxID=1859475 RepID=UPI00203E7DB5|nr:aldo/keto reductase [Floricoccus penangensis]URZ88101.1 aldo/keto reductase [Floricoccus penangensis]
MEYAKLNNGIEMPMAGFGVYQIPKEDCKQAVLDALEVGYRLIDTAQSYFNEKEVGYALAETKVPREEIFLTTKVWIDNYGQGITRQSILDSMRRLKVDYIDLVLLHQPFSDYYAAYHELEKLYKEGKIRAIGVSNFAPDRLADIAAFNSVVPQVNQVEVNPFNQQIKAQEYMLKEEIQMEAWAPFGEGRNDIFNNETLTSIGKKYGKSAAQVILRWLLQRDIISLAKSTKKVRMEENFSIFDFELSDQDMKEIQKIDQESSLFFDHQAPETVEMFVKFIEERRK